MTEGVIVGDDKDLQQVWSLLMKGCAVLMILGAAMGGCMYMNDQLGLEDDHIAEQLLEDAVEDYLGLPDDSIDFSPNKEHE